MPPVFAGYTLPPWYSMVSQPPDADMVVKPGYLAAAAPGQANTMVSDGKRMRILWLDGDGDGDPNKSFIARSKTSIRGHPTWKLCAGDVPDPIVRGKDQPPRNVYLDDQACYAIYSSRAYGKKDLSTFWPYDFNSLGNIKTNRPNRGRPAYSDSSCTIFARGPLRGGKTEGYEFCGAPTSPGQHAPDWRAKKEAAQAQAKKMESSAQISLSGSIPVLPSPFAIEYVVTPRGHPIGDNDSVHPARPLWKQDRIKYERATPNHYVSGPIDGNLKPLGMSDKAIQGSLYLDVPSAAIRKRPRPIPGDMAAAYAGFKAKRKAEDAWESEQKKIKVEEHVGDLDELTAMAEKPDVSE